MAKSKWIIGILVFAVVVTWFAVYEGALSTRPVSQEMAGESEVAWLEAQIADDIRLIENRLLVQVNEWRLREEHGVNAYIQNLKIRNGTEQVYRNDEMRLFSAELRMLPMDGHRYRSGEGTYRVEGMVRNGEVVCDLALREETEAGFVLLIGVNTYRFQREPAPEIQPALGYSGFVHGDAEILEVRYHPELGHVAPARRGGENLLLQFDEGKKLVAEHVLPEQEFWGIDWDLEQYREHLIFEFLEAEKPYLLFTDSRASGSQFFLVEPDGFTELQASPLINVDGGDWEDWYCYRAGADTVELYYTTDTEHLVGYEDAYACVLGRVMRDREQVGYVQFPAGELHGFFGVVFSGSWDFEGDDTKAEYDPETLEFTLRSPAAGQVLRCNFLTHGGAITHDMAPKDISRVHDTSPDGRYELVLANEGWGGDSMNWGNLAVHEKATGEMRFLTMSGSNHILTPVQFLDDETILHRPLPEQLTFYRTEDLEPYREVVLAFAQEREGRYAFCTTYDGQTDRFYVAYAQDTPPTDWGVDLEGVCYRVAVFDGEGRQTGDMQTAVPCGTAPIYYLPCPTMRMSGATLLLSGQAVDLAGVEWLEVPGEGAAESEAGSAADGSADAASEEPSNPESSAVPEG